MIGAGLSGLTAAYELQKVGCKVLVLEAKQRVGGRLLNQTIPGGVVDGGGSWIGPQQTAVLALLHELDIATWPQYTSGKNLYIWNGRIKPYTGDTPAMSLPALLDAGWNMTRLDRMARKAKKNSAFANECDQLTLGQWMDQHVRTAETKFMFEMMVATSFGCKPAELSLYGFLAHVAAAGSIQTLTGTQGAALDRHVVGGTAHICETLARLLDDAVALGEPVVKINRTANSATVRTANGSIYEARHVVIAVDPQTAGAIRHEPELPAARKKLEDSYAMGSGYKVHFVYDKPFWRSAGLSGASIANTGVCRITFDVTPPDAAGGVLMSFIGKAAIANEVLLEPAAREARQAQALRELANRFGPAALHPISYIEQNWSREPFQSGCVPMPGTGVLSSAGNAITEPVANLHFAGAESSDIWEGHMDGAVRAGKRAAQEIKDALSLD